MVSVKNFKALAMSFPEATELPHFEKPSFRVRKKIFVTLSESLSRITIKLSPIDQSAFCTFDRSVIYPVPGKWGLQGWTIIELKKIPKSLLIDALTTAYCEVAPESLGAAYSRKETDD
ncbi:MAG TPA: MmcQ/YjbR family DNA-binding protein [Chitinophagaceae bacterium]|jgi:hypothetical protein|nr:MmcQ/YjbR family DNA-binding protein [Chitinophagaceae bacterium]